MVCGFEFQSTPSAWRETSGLMKSLSDIGNFNPLPPHGGRPVTGVDHCIHVYFNPLPPHGGRLERIAIKILHALISIHSLRMEGDYLHLLTGCRMRIFQSTPSAWRETIVYFLMHTDSDISIHSLRMEGDPSVQLCHCLSCSFQSTPSAWRETY